MKTHQKRVFGLLAFAAILVASWPAAAGCQEGNLRCMDPRVILVIEELLTNNGYDPGRVDGIYDRRTAVALALFKFDRHLDKLSDEVVVALGLDKAVSY